MIKPTAAGDLTMLLGYVVKKIVAPEDFASYPDFFVCICAKLFFPIGVFSSFCIIFLYVCNVVFDTCCP